MKNKKWAAYQVNYYVYDSDGEIVNILPVNGYGEACRSAKSAKGFVTVHEYRVHSRIVEDYRK